MGCGGSRFEQRGVARWQEQAGGGGTTVLGGTRYDTYKSKRYKKAQKRGWREIKTFFKF